MLRTVYTPKKVVKEAYFGTSKNLEEGVKQLEIIIKKIKACNYIQLLKLNINETSENKKLQECFKKEFGFKDMNLFWDNAAIPNAYTVSGGFIFDSAPDQVSGGSNRQNNRYFDHEHRYIANIVVFMYLVKRLDLSAKETMGVILHEIGHNFDVCLPTKIGKCFQFIVTSGVVDLQRMLMKNVSMPVQAFVQNKMPIIKKIVDLTDEFRYHMNFLPGDISNVIYYFLTAPHQIIFASLGYQGEKYSDKFAASYGFGPDLSSALNKMDDPTKIKGAVKSTLYTIPILRSYYDLLDSSCAWFSSIFDPHPNTETRIYTINEKLKKDLADPKVPNALKDQIKKELADNKQIYERNKKMTGREWAIGSAFFKYINTSMLDSLGDIDIRSTIVDIITIGRDTDEL